MECLRKLQTCTQVTRLVGMLLSRYFLSGKVYHFPKTNPVRAGVESADTTPQALILSVIQNEDLILAGRIVLESRRSYSIQNRVDVLSTNAVARQLQA